MAPELRHPRHAREDPVHDQIVVAPDSEVSVSSDDVYRPRRQATNYPEFGGPPTLAKGPNLAYAVADTASRSAPKSLADKPSKPVGLSTRQQGHSKSRRNLQDPDGSFDVSGKGKVRATPASGEETPQKKPKKATQLLYCAACQQRKSRPAVTGTGQRNGNAKHGCRECTSLRDKVPEQAERPLGEKEARSPAQPEQQDVSTAGKERPQPPEQKNVPPILPIPGKQEFVAFASKSYQVQHDGSEFETESDDPDNPPLSNLRNPNVDRFGTATGLVKEHMAPVPKADLYDKDLQPVFFDSDQAAQAAQQGVNSYHDRWRSSYPPPPGTESPTMFDSSRFPDAAGMDPSPEPRSPLGSFDQAMEEALEHSRDDVEASTASRPYYDDRDEVDASLYLNNIPRSNLSNIANQALAHQSVSPRSVRPDLQCIDPAILHAVRWGNILDQIIRRGDSGLDATMSDPMRTDEEGVPVNPPPASTSNSSTYGYANTDWTRQEESMAEFNAHHPDVGPDFGSP